MKFMQCLNHTLLALTLCSSVTALAAETVYQKVDSKVVCIRSTMNNGSTLTGTGFFIAPNVVATVAHQVESAETVIVHLADGRKSEAKYLLSKPAWDVALIQVPATNIQGLPLTAELPALGNETFTIGCPLDLDHSLSRGVVSNPKRQLEGRELIQTDLVVNSGNSGGPLFNAQGEVIGLIMGSFKGATGLNFAVPTKFLNLAIKEAGLTNKTRAALPVQETAPPAPTTGLPAILEQLQANPSSPELNAQAAVAYFEMNQLEKARDHYLKALQTAPEHHQILTNLGHVYYKLGDHERSKEYLIKAISIDPNFPVAYLNLGMVYANGLNNHKSARQAFARFLELDGHHPKAREVQQWMESHP
ncbi:MAG: tetratricopeptide repeat protein [Magnetococcales bacterium]|nr:trypsin-like peptidase domain-containing protein [Magnetococcales bacterium]NGZ26820.1 tetratricopeptide repeat protein [Magnetococcales bacterium]